MQDFVHLHVHTQYSLLDGQSKIPNIVDKAIADGMRGMAITDHGNMMGVKELADYVGGLKGKAKKKLAELEAKQKDADAQDAEQLAEDIEKQKRILRFMPIFGCEMYVAHRRKEDKSKDKGDASGYHLIVLAKNLHGYKNLIKLVSRSWVDGLYYKPRTDRADLEKYHEDLIVSSACIAGEVPHKILHGDIAGAREAIEWYKRVFGDDYYLELQRHEVKDPNVVANRETFPLQQQANAEIIKLASEYGIKLICTNDCHFENQETAEAHDHLLCLATGKDLDDPNRMRYSKQEWFKTRQEMNEVFADVPEALSNTCEICDKISEYSIDNGPIMPFFPIPEDFGTEQQWRERITEEQLYAEFTSDEHGQNPLPKDQADKVIERLGGFDKIYRIKFEADYLAKLAYDGARRLYGDPVPEDVAEHINFELHVMKTMGFPGYFLIVQDFINAARNELGVVVGPGRGSAAGSVVAYCLGITKIDPLKYDLLFERFLNPDRVNLPDIDTDFDDDGRGKVLKWVMDKYGHENCAHIITYATMAMKNSLKDVARVEKLPLQQANALCKAIPDKFPDKMKQNLANAIKITPELQRAEISSDPKESNTIKYARMLEGTIRGTGLHACGFIICRSPISDWVPVCTADDPDFPGVKTAVTQYDGHVIESTGLIKMDFLGLKTLSELKEACRVVKQTMGDVVDLDTIPIDDSKTYELYQQGNTIGTFQFESNGMQKYLRELHPTVFEDLIAMNALYRPGPMDKIPEFIRRKKDPSLITYDIPCMEKYLKDTYGITVYQEQVMLLSRLLANFTRGESDALRKAMGKKKKAIVDAMKPKFLKQGCENGHDEKVLEKIWGEWEKFAEYAFNKSHATCYSWVAYQTAYMKAHYPSEYMAALMTRRFSDITEITKLMEECQRMRISTLGPDVNESYMEFGVNAKGEIRFGLSAVKGMGGAAAKTIVDERREHGPYKDIYDFMERVNLSLLNRKFMECLALSGAFDCFGIEREAYFAPYSDRENFLEALMKYGANFQQEKNEAQNSLFDDIGGMEIPHPAVPAKYEKWSNMERLDQERSLVGVYLSGHPLDPYAVIMELLCNTSCSQLGDLEKLRGKQIVLGGMVTAVRTGLTKKGSPYGIVHFEDFDGDGEIPFFGSSWPQWQNFLQLGYAVLLHATVEPRRFVQNSYDLRVNKVEYLSDVKAKGIAELEIHVNVNMLNAMEIGELCALVEGNPGNTSVMVSFSDSDKYRNIMVRSRKRKVKIERPLIEFMKHSQAFSKFKLVPKE
jgi:DNA polymerase III subunit alpha